MVDDKCTASVINNLKQKLHLLLKEMEQVTLFSKFCGSHVEKKKLTKRRWHCTKNAYGALKVKKKKRFPQNGNN